MLITNQLQEPKFIPIQTISDDRGLLVPITDQIGEELIKRSYIVEDYGPGVIRGLHYHKKEFKIFTIVSGAGKIITLKLNEALADQNNPEEIKRYVINNPQTIKTFVLSSRHRGVVVIPPYHANGWMSLEDHTILVSLSNLRFEEAKDDDIRIEPMIIGENYWRVVPR